MTSTWILLAQGCVGKILEVRKNGQEILLIKEFFHPETSMKGININADRQGRTFERHGPTRHAMDNPDPVKDHERHLFAKEIAAFLDKAFLAHQFAGLIFVAAPDLLGELRRAIPKHLHPAVKHELHKDLISQPMTDAELVEKVRRDLNLACF